MLCPRRKGGIFPLHIDYTRFASICPIGNLNTYGRKTKGKSIDLHKDLNGGRAQSSGPRRREQTDAAQLKVESPRDLGFPGA